MRVPINLASQPLENLRSLRAGVVLASITALLFGTVILRHELRNRSEFRALIEQRDGLQASLSALRSEQEELDGWLRTPEAEQIRSRSAFLNALILRKSLSWTQIFMDLERLVPPRVRITSIKPSLGASHDADLALVAAADSMSPLVELVKRLEASPKFGSTVVGSQKSSSQSSAEEGVQIDVTTRYIQNGVSATAPAEAAPAEVAPAEAQAPEEEEAEEEVAEQPAESSDEEAPQ